MVIALCATVVYGQRQRRLEFQRNSRTDVATASRLLEEGRTTDGIAHLLRAARRDQHNPAIAPRLASLLTSRNFLLPEGAAVTQPSPVLWTDFSPDGKSAGVLWSDGAHASIDLATGAVERWQLPSPPQRGTTPIALRGFLAVRCEDGVTRVLDFAGRQTQEFRFDAERQRSRRSSSSRRDQSSNFFTTTLANRTIVVADAASGRTLPPIPIAGAILGVQRTEKWLLWREGEFGSLAPEVHVRDSATGTTELTLRVPSGIFTASLSPTGQQMAVVQRESEDNALFLRRYSLPDLAPLGPAQPIESAAAGVTPGMGLSYSPDGRYIVSWPPTPSILEVWDAQTGTRIARIPAAGGVISSTHRISPDSRTLATFANLGLLDLWDLSTGTARVAPLKHGGNVLDVAFSADGVTLGTTATDGLVRVWDVASGQLLAEPTLQQRTAPVAALSPDRTQVTIGTREGALYRFRIGQGRAKSVELPRTPQPMPAPFLPGSPSRVLQMLGDRARVIDAATGREVPGGFVYPEPIRARTGTTQTNNGSSVRTDFKVMAARTISGAC
ncbi:MAG: hypothetical protein EXS32_16080 [Opitutus sp.]|nr:hypothetical protein [Opitutus sp.]